MKGLWPLAAHSRSGSGSGSRTRTRSRSGWAARLPSGFLGGPTSGHRHPLLLLQKIALRAGTSSWLPVQLIAVHVHVYLSNPSFSLFQLLCYIKLCLPCLIFLDTLCSQHHCSYTILSYGSSGISVLSSE